VQLLRPAGVRGTPTIFINGRKMGGRLTPDGFRVAIDAVLEKAGKTVRNY